MAYPPPDQQPCPPPQYPVYAGGHPYRAVTRSRKNTSHGLHLFLTIITGGAWGLFVWLPLTIWHRIGRRERTVTHYR